MTAIAHVVQVDPLRRGVDIWLGYETNAGIEQWLGDGLNTRRFTPYGESTEASRPSFSLREDIARALLESLNRHFQGGEDTRSLRRDYDDERKRVDRLIEKLSNPVVIHGEIR